MRSTIKRTILLSLLAIAAAVNAQTAMDRVTITQPEIGKWDINDPVGTWPFFGAGLGYADHNETVRSEGMPTTVRMIGSYYMENRLWVFDLGMGFNNHFLVQAGSGSDDILSAGLELSGRYRLAQGWQIGPAWTTIVGTDRYNSVNNMNTSFFGVQGLKEFTYKSEYLVRVGGRLLTDIDVKGENLNMAMFEIAVGFVPSSTVIADSDDVWEEDEILAEELDAAPEINTKPLPPLVVKLEQLRMAQFMLNEAKLARADEARLVKFAKVLKNNSHLFSSIEVVGHADPTGPESLNSRLSLERAQVVAETLKSAGLSEKKIEVFGRGALQPLSDSLEPSALSISRRTEIQFRGVTDAAALDKLIRAL